MSVDDSNQRIAGEWRARVETRGGWRKTSSHAGGLFDVDANGEAGGFFVELNELRGRRAYLKPLKRHDWRRAAREKIAADLAWELCITVPPVLLSINEDARAERYVCVSLVLFPQQFSWGQLEAHMAEGEGPFAAVRARLINQAASTFVFDTWLGQSDHQKPSNIVYGYEGASYADGRFVFLDYAFSMGISGNWAGDGYRRCDPAPFPAYMVENFDEGAVLRSVERVEQVSNAAVEEIVSRIPWQWLRDEERQTILTGLLARRTMVRSSLGRYLERSL